ncbi:binding-protein-dependent transport systems inner membrane component [Segniliparus rotundus DSM 44985]|uniref:Binding-protein-dependent transport systems inner membrane component n=1 Tax=Segniliparus rotundus (strain ATCC BAA-972 / CDC 1076 / CIP 108378 / DSM 44985 / JCM 13578) TaxID=640132 RepID=D6Z8V6_SEGRD|nr:carbohydrate ABC transporter permease [Segniliparus rotundus]ADG98386.1 binding-protein-dependent transport systems inner membrane component [Segniliparus rotundus DSM 44985]
MRSGSRPGEAARAYLILGLASLLVLAPYALSVLTSFTTPQQYFTRPPLALPDPPTAENYLALGQAGFGRAALVTALVVAFLLLGQIVFSAMAAFAFAHLRFRGRDALFWAYLATLMVPPVTAVVPWYLIMGALGLRGTFWALVLPYVLGSPYAVYLLREHFRQIPEELITAARLDGASTFDVFYHVIMPVSRPVLATLALITVVANWNSFLWPLIATAGPKWQVLSVATANLQSREAGNWTLVTAATTVAILPLLVCFLLAGRGLVRSIALTGLK